LGQRIRIPREVEYCHVLYPAPSLFLSRESSPF